MRRTLYTIGYEGAEIGQFLDTLVACGIKQVLDIRDVPVSRKRGFSKATLIAALDERDIRYWHFKALGDPKAGREAMRRGDYPAFFEIYSDHLSGELAQAALRDAVKHASARPSVLLCFERSPNECHRKIVAGEMEAVADFEIRNIGVNPRAVSAKSGAIDAKTLEEIAL